jgi:nucleotidyltransferase substrate binding protein (TIGR01987 family)
MERLQERIAMAERVLKAFEEVMTISNPSSIERDAAIQRFEFTFEALWKAAKQMLFDIEGIDVGSPKGVIRSCREVGIFTDTETTHALEMVNDRNLTVHTYNEALAIEIYEHLWYYLQLMQRWLEKIKVKATSM